MTQGTLEPNTRWSKPDCGVGCLSKKYEEEEIRHPKQILQNNQREVEPDAPRNKPEQSDQPQISLTDHVLPDVSHGVKLLLTDLAGELLLGVAVHDLVMLV